MEGWKENEFLQEEQPQRKKCNVRENFLTKIETNINVFKLHEDICIIFIIYAASYRSK